MKKAILLIAVTILLSSFVFAEESKIEKETDVYTSIEEAKESGKPIICFFYTQKSCACTNKKCKRVLDDMAAIREKLPENFSYCEIETNDYPELVKEYRLMSLPVLIIFDDAGEVASRLDSWKINWENIEKALSDNEKG